MRWTRHYVHCYVANVLAQSKPRREAGVQLKKGL
jgi:hypothetical protein